MRRDRVPLRRLVNILLDNALKYTPAGGVVTVSFRRAGQQLCLAVRDTGIGIPAEELPYIFDRFYRADISCNRDQGGSGLELAIAKWISETHHAEFHVSWELRRGSAFSLSFEALIEFHDVDSASASQRGEAPKAYLFPV